MKALHKAALIGAALFAFVRPASAQLTNQGVLDQVVIEFATRASAWQTVVMNAATFLFWTLGAISLVVTFGFLALRKADIGEFFAEFIRFILFFGFFLWLLRNGPNFATSIIQSLSRIGEQASGISSMTPSGIVDVGFAIWKQAIDALSVWSPIDSFVGTVLSAGILILLALVAVNMLMLLVSAWLLSYAGIFFLGFGGSRWTSDMAINYYKTVLGVAVQIMTMVLLVGIGNDLLSSFYAKMNKGTLNFEELGVMLVFCLALMLLVNRVPPLVAGIITGASVGGAGIGQFGAGAAFGAAGMAAAAAATGGAALAAGAASAAGGASAMMAAFSKASDNVASGTDILSAFSGTGSGLNGSTTDSSFSGAGSTPFAQAAGFTTGAGGAATSSKPPVGGDGDGFRGFGKGPDKTGSPNAGSGQMGDKGANQAAGKDSRPSGGAGQGQQTSPGATGNDGLASALGAAGRIAADTGANLARGTAEVARAKGESLLGAVQTRIAATTGGKIAAAIRAHDSAASQAFEATPAGPVAPTFDGNSLQAAATEADPESEVAAFASRPPYRDGARS